MIDTLIYGLVVIAAAIGLVVLLVVTGIIELRNPTNNKILYSALVITLLGLVLLLFTKALNLGEGGLSSSNNECDQEDPPFWCHLDTE